MTQPTAGRTVILVVAGIAAAGAGLFAGTLAAQESTRAPLLILAAAFLYLALFLWQPTIALLAYIAVRPFVDAFVYQGFRGFTLGELWGLGMVVSACLFLMLEIGDKRDELRLAVVPLGFLLSLGALTFTRPGLIVAIAGWTKVASWLLVMLACERISRSRDGQRMCWWAGMGMSMALIASVGIMIAQGRFGSAFYGDPPTAISGQLPHPLSIGAVLLLPFALTGVLLAGRRALSLLVTAGLLAAVVLSYVRTALFGGLVVLLGLLVVTASRRGPQRIAGVLVAVGVAAGVYVARAPILERFADLSLLAQSGAEQGGAGSGRLAIWRAALDASFDNPEVAFLGDGAGAAERVMERVLQMHVGAQNDLLDFLLAGGLLLAAGYVALLLWMGATPIGLLRDRRQSANVAGFAVLALSAVIAFTVMSLLNGIATYQPAVAVGLLIGLARGMLATPGGTFLDDQPTESGPAGMELADRDAVRQHPRSA